MSEHVSQDTCNAAPGCRWERDVHCGTGMFKHRFESDSMMVWILGRYAVNTYKHACIHTRLLCDVVCVCVCVCVCVLYVLFFPSFIKFPFSTHSRAMWCIVFDDLHLQQDCVLVCCGGHSLPIQMVLGIVGRLRGRNRIVKCLSFAALNAHLF